ncbi:MAG: Fpg/Nei family DNA glycosylase [Microbacteriaceae bacterium]|nr:Fpg/Nei family DNA glycosylase [Microbacteriaceae bacterium]
MPEGHSVHRIARQFNANFPGKPLQVSSPQGRFTAGAEMLDGDSIVEASAVGKHLFIEFERSEHLHVHLGIYGAWDFVGEVTVDATIASANGWMGQTNQRGTLLTEDEIFDAAGENSLTSIGAPRKSRFRFGEATKEMTAEEWPPEPVGQVRVRLQAVDVLADLRGPTTCEVISASEKLAILDRLGPDPVTTPYDAGLEIFLQRAGSKKAPIGQLLMDQNVIAGIGNVYRAEILFRLGINPYTPGNALSKELLTAIWDDWVRLLPEGIETGQMMTMDDLSESEWIAAMANRDDRHWVYHRAGKPCRVCGTPISLAEMQGRKLYWCANCQQQ